MRRATYLWWIVMGFLLRPDWAIGELSAGTFGERHAGDLLLNPPDLHFRLETAGGQRKFQIGERISLKLQFSSDSPDKFKLNGATYDRSGRLPTEEFVLEQQDTKDPYEDYFGTGVIGGLAGGIRGYPVLTLKPYEIALDLNDWYRFDHPGSYRLYLKSHRLTRERTLGEPGGRTVDFAAVSNVLEIEILPENSGWQSAKLAAIRAVLAKPEPEQPKPGGPPVPIDPLEDEITQARRELRFLETPGAIDLAFEDSRMKGTSPDTLLLVGARDRQHMLSAFDRFLADPNVAVSEWNIRVRALFSYLAKDTPKPLPMLVWQWPDGKADWEKLRATAESRQKRFEEILQQEATHLIPIASAKNAAARKASGEAIAAIVPDAAKAASLVPPDDYGLSREELIQRFAELSAEQQAELLDKKWDLIRGSEIAAGLLTVIARAKYEKPTPMPDSFPLGVWGIEDGIAAEALRRLAEISPDDAARIVRADIASGAPRFAGFAVREFPAREIPEADDGLRNLLKTDLHTGLPLVAKFATAQLMDEVLAVYKSRKWPCTTEGAFLSFFLRTSPGKNGEGQRLLRQAMTDRQDRGCYRDLLSRVASSAWDTALESMAITGLNDSDPEVVSSAAQALSNFGGPAAEPALWKRAERWSEEWQGRATELAGHPITGTGSTEQSRLGDTLFRSLASAKSWWFDDVRRKRLAVLCVEQWCRDRWSRETAPEAIAIEVSSGGGRYPAAFRVDEYTGSTIEDLKAKLAYAPTGTQFRWCPQANNPFDALSPGQRDDMFREIAAFLEKRDHSIQPYETKRCGH